jgi:hypothetical protein
LVFLPGADSQFTVLLSETKVSQSVLCHFCSEEKLQRRSWLEDRRMEVGGVFGGRFFSPRIPGSSDTSHMPPGL